MSKRLSSRRLFFVHIPKCAGTTVGYLMRYKFGIGLMNVRDVRGKGDAKAARKAGRHLAFAHKLHPWFRAANGHGIFLNQEIHDRYPGAFWFTILREPRSRYLSHHSFERDTLGLQEPLEDWIRRGAMSNIQVKWLAGEPNLQKAIDVLENLVDFTGRLDQLEYSLAMMAKAADIDLSAPTGYKANTAKSAKPQLSDELKALVEKNNELDIQLWEYFLANIWPRQLEKYGDAVLESRPKPTLRDKINEWSHIGWRGLVYVPATKVRARLR